MPFMNSLHISRVTMLLILKLKYERLLHKCNKAEFSKSHHVVVLIRSMAYVGRQWVGWDSCSISATSRMAFIVVHTPPGDAIGMSGQCGSGVVQAGWYSVGWSASHGCVPTATQLPLTYMALDWSLVKSCRVGIPENRWTTMLM
ncbi:hypothetical protein J6590_015482 [Homalodisca vitripennis]|nr:hypothetical protein J6590_015482 [Homalodisca vitripennis]